jgi:hypothetical protein
MKPLKLNSQRKSSGQVIVLVVIVLVLVGAAFWWLYSTKQQMAKEGTEFAKEAVQRIAVQHDMSFFNSRLSPQERMNFPVSTQQEFMNEIVGLGTPVRPVDVQGKIEFQSQFFEPHGSFHARIYYPAKYADLDLTISHPVGRWQIDEISFLPEQLPGPGPALAPPPPAAPPPAASAPAAGSPAAETSPATETSPAAETSPATEASPAPGT